ncbi:hypothetical protein HMPREF9348_02751 [Escherichia coli MS 145-7]|nr:hypothetical protein HMPREF9348_02751 [Escherichia coli MS 145-7]
MLLKECRMRRERLIRPTNAINALGQSPRPIGERVRVRRNPRHYANIRQHPPSL